jgi:UDP-N-acetylmuramate--alanine ligase
MHNILNALRGRLRPLRSVIPAEAVEQGLSTFLGAGRRFEYKGTFQGPWSMTIMRTIPASCTRFWIWCSRSTTRRTILAFQPHTFTRTKALFGDFLAELSRADQLLLAEIYAAREKNTIGISSKDLAD